MILIDDVKTIDSWLENRQEVLEEDIKKISDEVGEEFNEIFRRECKKLEKEDSNSGVNYKPINLGFGACYKRI